MAKVDSPLTERAAAAIARSEQALATKNEGASEAARCLRLCTDLLKEVVNTPDPAPKHKKAADKDDE